LVAAAWRSCTVDVTFLGLIQGRHGFSVDFNPQSYAPSGRSEEAGTLLLRKRRIGPLPRLHYIHRKTLQRHWPNDPAKRAHWLAPATLPGSHTDSWR